MTKKKQAAGSWRWNALVMFVLTLIVNGLAGSTAIIAGQNTKAISDAYPTLFTPTGATFAIWGIIYIGLTIFMARALGVLRTGMPKLPEPQLEQVLRLFTISGALNITWLLMWQYELLWLSVPLMIGLLVTLLRIHGILNDANMSFTETLAVRVPFSVYVGWITVATIANVSVFLVSTGWDGFGISPVLWTVIMLSIGAVIAGALSLRRVDPAYILVLAWAYNGIMNAASSGPGGTDAYNGISDDGRSAVMNVALFWMIVFGFLALYTGYQRVVRMRLSIV